LRRRAAASNQAKRPTLAKAYSHFEQYGITSRRIGKQLFSHNHLFHDPTCVAGKQDLIDSKGQTEKHRDTTCVAIAPPGRASVTAPPTALPSHASSKKTGFENGFQKLKSFCLPRIRNFRFAVTDP
jgi:hypothetical protein